jgi:hypothetical protein
LALTLPSSSASEVQETVAFREAIELDEAIELEEAA